jgi:hypothetical protein
MTRLCEVDDAQPVRSQANMTERGDSPIVGSPMALEVAHLRDDGAVIFFTALPLQTN